MIIILTQCFPSRVGGIETLMYNIALHLSRSKDVIVLADQQNFKEDNIFDQNEINFSTKRFRGIKFFRNRKKFNELKKIHGLSKIDAVISDSWKSLEVTIDFLKKNKIPVISLAHGNEIIIKNDKHHKRVKKILEHANAIVVNSNYTKNLLNKISNNFKNVKIIYPGINIKKNYIEENISLNQGSPKLLTLARLEKRKGHALILKSIMNLKKYFPDIQYIIAGEGEELDSIKNKIKEYNLQDNVNLVGTVNENQKNYIFSNTDLMIMPTLDESSSKSIEGFGIAYIEAANFKIPSIASDIGGTPEAVIHNKTGLIIKDIDELDEAIKSLIDNNEDRLTLGQNAKIRAENELNWDIQIKKYNDLIKEIQ